MAEHNDKGEYNKPMPVKKPVASGNGYPNDVKSSKTMKMRGTGAQTKGTNFNPNSCIQMPFSASIGNISITKK